MPDTSLSLDEDFSAQLQALVSEAERKISAPAGRAHAAKLPEAGPRTAAAPSSAEARVGLDEEERTNSDLLKSLLSGVNELRILHENNAASLRRIDNAMGCRDEAPKLLDEARQMIEQRNVVNKAMFDALHAELKEYKDSFMLESVLKPVIRDLITLYDGTCEIGRQMKAAVGETGARGGVDGAALVLFESMNTTVENVDHHGHFILEVLERLDVVQLPEGSGKLDKRTQRVMAAETAANPKDDLMVVKVLKRGFASRDRVVRPEEVIIKKWTGDGISEPESKQKK